jgi:hypothetical protein
MKRYTHINDCWEEIEHCKTYDELVDTIENFPRWSGDWEIISEDGHYTVINTYYDKQCEVYETDSTETDIEVEEDEDDRSELPWDYGKHFN